MQKARGSAIVIAMLLVTAVGAVGFTFGKVLNIQITNETLYENGVGAYYSAESGIEEGFLRYRYDHNSVATPTEGQVPSFLGLSNPAQRWLNLPKNVIRANLTSSIVYSNPTTGMPKSSLAGITDPNTQYYDLRMGSKIGSTAGDPTFNPASDPEQNFHINRDETKKIDLGGIFNVGDDITLSFKASNPISITQQPVVLRETRCTLVEVKLELQQTSTSPVIEKKKLLINSACDYHAIPNPVTIITDFATTVDYTYDGITGIATRAGLKTNIAPTIFYYQATLFLKPIGSDIDYSLQETGPAVAQNPLNGANSVVTSTGYYGGVARTLEADIDLTNGSLYDLYDFVIYKNQP